MQIDPRIVAYILDALWLILITYWAISAFGNKRSVYTQPRIQRLVYLFGFLLVMFLIFHTQALEFQIFRRTIFTQIAGIILCADGIAFAIWARRVLGTNWSGVVTLKENHELIRRGPYRIVRHPIYTGIVLAALGTVLATVPTVQGPLCVLAIIIGFRLKSLKEEELMIRQFPDAYPAYKREVRAIIPFVY
jgi:protein-S-isoprenylcysteine O-methyltransferase Ste14